MNWKMKYRVSLCCCRSCEQKVDTFPQALVSQKEPKPIDMFPHNVGLKIDYRHQFYPLEPYRMLFAGKNVKH